MVKIERTANGYDVTASIADLTDNYFKAEIPKRIVEEFAKKYVESNITDIMSRIDIDKIVQLIYLEIASQTGKKVFGNSERNNG